MCGIIGFNWADYRLLNAALRAIEHRGPDDRGRYVDKKISLGHNRLAIIDLSKKGRQPMANKDESLWITFNGEIYNYQELKNNLKQRHQFKSDTDTEVLLYLYGEKGANMLKDLQGMFAFCIYDAKKKELFLARDRVGIKPLYYYENHGKFIFSSEIKAILKETSIQRKVNTKAISSYVTSRANTNEETLFEDIKKLMPGHYLIYNLKKKKITTKRKYWDVTIDPQKISLKSATKKIRDCLEDSVTSRLIADVPYGLYLSGGVDSGVIAALMKKNTTEKVKTFSVGFANDKNSETKKAAFLAEHLGTDHHELIVSEKSIRQLPAIVHHADEPNADPTCIPTFLLSKYAKKYCTVILNGEGSDEILTGYPQYKFMKLRNSYLKHAPKISKRSLAALPKHIPPTILNKGFRFAAALGEKGIERFSRYLLAENPQEQYLNMVSIYNEEEQSELLKKKVTLYAKYKNYFSPQKDIVSSCQYIDFKNNMVEDLLMKVDKNTMAASIEGRVPFLDHRLVELSFQLPLHYKLKGWKEKHILRNAFKKVLPEQTRNRKKKHFFTPIDVWFSGELSNLKDELLSNTFIKKQKIFNPEYINKIYSGFEKSKLFYSRQLWALFMFQIWYKTHIKNERITI